MNKAQFYSKFFKSMSDQQLETEMIYQMKHGSDEIISLVLAERDGRDQ